MYFGLDDAAEDSCCRVHEVICCSTCDCTAANSQPPCCRQLQSSASAELLSSPLLSSPLLSSPLLSVGTGATLVRRVTTSTALARPLQHLIDCLNGLMIMRCMLVFMFLSTAIRTAFSQDLPCCDCPSTPMGMLCTSGGTDTCCCNALTYDSSNLLVCVDAHSCNPDCNAPDTDSLTHPSLL